MLARKSTHKRKRSSARADTARAAPSTRYVANLFPQHTDTDVPAPIDKPKQPPRAHPSFIKLIDQHPFNHSLELILPFQPATTDDDQDTTDDRALPSSVQELVTTLRSLSFSSLSSSYLARVPLILFLDPLFVTAYIRCGHLTSLSLGRLDSDDVICLDGQGTLILSLTKDTYQTLGLTGRPSHFSRGASGRAGDRRSGKVTRYIVELPLLSPSFVPGKKGYQQAWRCLKKWDHARAERRRDEKRKLAQTHTAGQMYAASMTTASSSSSVQDEVQGAAKDATWDVLFSWTPSVEAESEAEQQGSHHGIPTTISFPTHLVDSSTVSKFDNEGELSHRLDDVWLPRLDGDVAQQQQQQRGDDVGMLRYGWTDSKGKARQNHPSDHVDRVEWQEWQILLQDTLEWIGLASIGAEVIKTYTQPSSYSMYTAPQPSTCGSVLKLSWRGFLSTRLIGHVVSHVQQFLDTSATERGWAALCVGGFSDTPVSWRSNVPLSQKYGLPSNVASVAIPTTMARENVGFVRPSSPSASKRSKEERGEEEMNLDSSPSSSKEEEEIEESDSSLDLNATSTSGRAERKKRARKVKRRGHVRKGEVEQGFQRAGQEGWIGLCFAKSKRQEEENAGQRDEGARWIVVERLERDLRS